MIFGFILNCVNSQHELFFSPPDLRSLLDSPAAAVCRRCSPRQRQPCHNYQPPFPSLAATASDLSSSGPCCPCSSEKMEKMMSSPLIKGRTLFWNRLLLWQPVPQRFPCRIAQSGTGSPGHWPLWGADWRLEMRGEQFLDISWSSNTRKEQRRNLNLMTYIKTECEIKIIISKLYIHCDAMH